MSLINRPPSASIRPLSSRRISRPIVQSISSPTNINNENINNNINSSGLIDETLIYYIPNIDDNNFISSLKSDLFQIQMFNEKITRDNEKLNPISPAPNKSSRLRSNFNNIKQSSNDIDDILDNVTDINNAKLKLLSLLNIKMVSLELKLLNYSDRYSTKLTTIPFGYPSESRMPSFLALSERMIDLISQLETAVQPNKNDDEHLKHVTDSILEIESYAMKIASSCSLPNSELPSLFMTNFDNDKEVGKNLIEAHLKQISRYLNVINSKALVPLIEKTRALSDSQKSLQITLTDSSAEIAQLKSELTRSKLNSISFSNTQSSELESKLNEIDSALKFSQSELLKARDAVETQVKEKSDLEALFNKDVKLLENAIRQLQIQLEEQIRQRRNGEFIAYQDKEKALSSLDKVNINLNDQLNSKVEENSKLSQKVEELQSVILKLESKLKEQELSFWDAKKRHSESEVALAEQCDILQSQLSNIDPSASTSDIDLLQEQLKKSRKSLTSFELYHKDSLFDQQKMQADHRQEISQLKDEYSLEIDSLKDELKIKEEQITNITKMASKPKSSEEEEDPFEDMLREENRAMKAAYEGKLTKLKQAHSKSLQEESAKYKQMMEKLMGENKILENKLKQSRPMSP